MKPANFKNFSTSSLGFGCAKLTAHDSEQAARRTLEVAFEEGIRHFDVARLYGFGQAEGMLGRFIRDKRSQVTVTTKFGLHPPRLPFFNLRLLNLARRVVSKIPSLKNKVVDSAAFSPVRGRFSAKEAEESLNTSLRELQTDYVDILLLHECSLEDANQPEILKFLDSAVQAGKIRLSGLGTHWRNLPIDFHDIASEYSVIQLENNIQQNAIQQFANRDERLLITHGVFNTSQSKDPDTALEYARSSNPNGITLFSSTNIEHIRHNARIWRSLI
ncbi:MAG: aldo/keto reductase [Saprospiraceae bacterium]|nr:aldo/keto reductase [Saprospiraceae bacterium]